MPAYVERYQLRTKQLSERDVTRAGLALDKLNGKLDERIDAGLTRAVQQRQFIEAIEGALSESVPFRENVLDVRIASAHPVRNLQSAQSTLTTMYGELRVALEAHRKEDLEQHAEVAGLKVEVKAVTASIARVEDRMDERLDRVEGKIAAEAEKTQRAVKEHTDALGISVQQILDRLNKRRGEKGP